MKALALSAMLLLAASSAADAQQLSLTIGGGRVSLNAENVPVQRILEEWARVGSATVVNGESVGGGLVTLWLEDVPEAVALDVVLRGASGYLLAPRPVESTGASVFDRIVVLASSAAPPVAPRRVVTTRVLTPVPEEDEEIDPGNDLQPEPDVRQEPPAGQPNPRGFPFQIPPGSSDRPGVVSPAPEAE
jgi:hypothetical protein